ncbi:MAG TPA: hypothetical protein VGC65_00155 [Bacteroidia bacterium]|jgi:hypothetical protein
MTRIIKSIPRGVFSAVVANYAALPLPASAPNKYYWVSASQGTSWLPGSLGGTFYPNGAYYSNAVTWEYVNTAFQASQPDVDAGLISDQFVSPNTLENAAKWGTKISHSLATAANDFLVASGAGIFVKKTLAEVKTVLGLSFGTTVGTYAEGNKTNYWQTVPGTPARVGNVSFTITDAANANLYDMLMGRTTVLKWIDTGVTKMAMIVSATYSANNVTVTIIGDTLTATATMSSFTYTKEKCKPIVLAVAGTLAVGTGLTANYYTPCAMKIFGTDGYHGTAGTTNATTYDINKNGVTFMATKLSIASGATSGVGFTADSGTETATSDVISVDCDSVSTTAPVDAYIQLFMFPLRNQYFN